MTAAASTTPAPSAQVRIVGVAFAVVVVHVQVAQRRPRVGQPLVEAAADAGVADVEDEAEAAQVEVAGMREVRHARRRACSRRRSRRRSSSCHSRSVLEGAVERRDHGRVARRDRRAPVGVHHVDERPDLRARLEVPALLVERLEPHGLVEVPDAGVAEGPVDGVREARLPRRPPVALAEQRVQAERADLGGAAPARRRARAPPGA